MKVIHFISGIKSGGVEQFLYNYTSKLNSEFSVEQYIVYQHSPNDKSLLKLQKAGNTCIKIKNKARHPFGNMKDTYHLIKKIKPDIVHAHMNLVNFVPLIIAFFLKVPVRISHSHIATDNIDQKLFIKIFKKLNVLFANALFSCGNEAGKYMYGDKKFKVIRNAIDIQQFKYDEKQRKQFRLKYNINSTTKVFGNIGRFTKQKNQFYLLDIFNEYQKENPDSLLYIIGTGKLKKDLDDKITKLNLNKKVWLIKPMESTAPFYSMIDVFLLPSLYEGLPVTTIEAQVSRLPLLISDTIDQDIVLLEGTKQLPLNNDKAWVNSMNTISVNKSRGFVSNTSIRKYDINLCYKNLYKEYCKLIEKFEG